MSFCPKCGREIIDESLGCPICGVKENTRPETTQADEQPAEKVDSFTVELSLIHISEPTRPF